MKHVKMSILPCMFAAMLTLLLAAAGAKGAEAAPLNCGAWKIISSWTIEPRANMLNAVAAVSANDVWAVGSATLPGGFPQTLIEQWNGLTWNIVSSPNRGAGVDFLNGIAVVSADDIWAVGYYTKVLSSKSQTLIEHWNGTSWSVISSPNLGKSANTLTGITVISANDIWAVGTYVKNIGGITYNQTRTEHWDGRSWSTVSSPNVAGDDNFLNGVAAVSTNDI